MSTSTRACYGFTAHHPRSSARKATPHNFFGGVAVGGLVLGCAWTVYANVFGSQHLSGRDRANFDVAVVRRPAPAVRNALTAANSTIVMRVAAGGCRARNGLAGPVALVR